MGFNMDTAIIFFHQGKVPFYLRCAIESARFFNPELPVYVLNDSKPAFHSEWRIECVSLKDARHPALDAFVKNYTHISSSDLEYERRCFERWFYFEKIMSDYGLKTAVILDSDAVLFAKAPQLFGLLPERVSFACSKGGGPAMTLVRGSMEPFLAHMQGRFLDADYLKRSASLMEAARRERKMANLTDMTICEEFSTSNPLGFVYPNQTLEGHIDHGIWLPDGLDSKKSGRRHRKRVFWKEEKGVIQPFFRSASDMEDIRALCIHFQSKAKRYIRRFNQIGEGVWNSDFGRDIRLWYYNRLLN